MAEAKRRGYGEDGIYFDHRGDCRDSVQHKTCAGRWRGVVSLGFSVDGNRIRKKVSGKTRTEVKDKLKGLHSELDAGVRTTQGYTVEKAVTDWLAEGLPGRTEKTVEVNRDALRPLLAVIGTIPLRDLTVHDVRTALSKMAATHSTRTLQKAHNCLTRALRHAEGQDLVRRNVSALADTPRGREGRPSQSAAHFWPRPKSFRGLGAFFVTGANSRARACTKVCVAGAKLSQKNHLQAGQLLRTRQIVVLAREFAPVTLFPQLSRGRSQDR